MRHMKISLLLMLLAASPIASALNILACEPEWAALASVVAGPDAKITAATGAEQNPHHVQARPSLLSAVRRADMVICTGAGLEEAWLPVLLARGANPSVQRPPGLFLAATHVTLIDQPEQIDRAAGDVHAQGNPHFHLDPRLLPDIAQALAKQMGRLRPAEAESFRARAEAFSHRWEEQVARWSSRAEPLRKASVIVHHRSWNYLARWLELSIIGELEPKPGVPPSPAHLASLQKTVESSRALVLRAPFDDARPSQWLAQRSQACPLVLPFSVATHDEAGLTMLFERLVQSLLDRQEQCSE